MYDVYDPGIVPRSIYTTGIPVYIFGVFKRKIQFLAQSSSIDVELNSASDGVIFNPKFEIRMWEWFRFFNAVYEQLGGGEGGATGTFTTVDSKTVTVVNGIITGIV